ncbi:hypothetical protein Taro_047417 [Colocasia esculenta]|uniref:Uncharacterized protein n=1 Tax=Colocasia esculenta TaxID=4460 RepID=A0A843X3U6_COLES|nr:hypothetical protein [Colocasia esculenta]
MANEFSVPSVVFPNAGGNPSVPVQQRAPTGFSTFQPQRLANPGPNPSLPFMSFDIGSAPASSSFSGHVFGGSSYSAGGAGAFEDEPPLLEELGINTRQIWRKTRSILNPIRVNANLHEDADISSPFLFLMAFGLFQLRAGKLHFGIILGWVTVAAFTSAEELGALVRISMEKRHTLLMEQPQRMGRRRSHAKETIWTQKKYPSLTFFKK